MFEFENSYSKLPERFYAPAHPARVAKPELIEVNWDFLKNELGADLSSLSDSDLAELFTGQVIPKGATPIALAYSGHQFGHFNPTLGDGRAILLGEVSSPEKHQYDIVLKGSGITPFSRSGDGKSSLGPVIREYIVSEAMFNLGVPTTRSLAACTTGEDVYREEALPGGVFTRVASSHVRIGTFEYFAARKDLDAVKKLADYSLERLYPEITNEDNKYLQFLKSVANAQATLVAHWMALGFIHGVMNTDNMSISGETLDYGPCAFIDNFAANRVFSFIDRQGRYAYNNQIQIAKWNLYRLAECLIPLIDEDSKKALNLVEESLVGIDELYEKKWLEKMAPKFGLKQVRNGDKALVTSWLHYLETEDLDFTLSFRTLSESHKSLKQTPELEIFLELWQKRLKEEDLSLDETSNLMKQVNPIYIPRNHQVEAAIQLAYRGDFSKFKEMNLLFKRPFEEQADYESYKLPPLESERVLNTFCGT